MAGQPLVSVITPTWQRYDLLLGRCMPSVAAQDYGSIEHIIVSDGPDPDLAERVAKVAAWSPVQVRYGELPAHGARWGDVPASRWGVNARLRGLEMARGDYIAYLDDDNSFRPDHVSRLAGALEANPNAGFAYSRMQVSGRGTPYLIGTDPPRCGLIDTSQIMHRAALAEAATWRDDGPQVQETVDWDLVARWMDAGAAWVLADAVTCDYYFNG